MTKMIFRHIVFVALLALALNAVAQNNDKILNRPYADAKLFHYGFSVGLNFQNLNIANKGLITEDGESWFADIPDNSPGFCVNVLADMRLGNQLNLRVSPGMYFGNKVVKWRNVNYDPELQDPTHNLQSQNIKATYVVIPVDIKYSALRYHNMRPYFTGGMMALYDVGKERPEHLRLKDIDVMLTLGLGCDFYLPFFKLCPELKFCFGLRDILQRDRPDLEDNPEMMRFTQSVNKVQNNMVVLTFYFE